MPGQRCTPRVSMQSRLSHHTKWKDRLRFFVRRLGRHSCYCYTHGTLKVSYVLILELWSTYKSRCSSRAMAEPARMRPVIHEGNNLVQTRIPNNRKPQPCTSTFASCRRILMLAVLLPRDPSVWYTKPSVNVSPRMQCPCRQAIVTKVAARITRGMRSVLQPVLSEITTSATNLDCA